MEAVEFDKTVDSQMRWYQKASAPVLGLGNQRGKGKTSIWCFWKKEKENIWLVKVESS